MAKSEPCRILQLEDNELDRELVRQTLMSEGLAVEMTYAETRDEFVRALATAKFDLVMSDFTLPGYSGAEALEWVHKNFPGLPFIFVSGSIGEQRANECLKNGATDYILKDDPGRLVQTIRRVVQEHARRREGASE